jgi:ParB family chromosome partitioning protein
LIVIAAEGMDRYALIAGERRLRAAKLAGLKEVPAIVRTASQQEQLEFAIIENVQREDLNPIERARAYQNLQISFL